MPSWVLKFHSVGELSCQGCELEIVSNCVPFCYWKGAKFAENEFSGSILCVKVVYFTESTIAAIAKYFMVPSTNKLSAGEYEIRMSGKCL